jgi:TPR repeat protein
MARSIRQPSKGRFTLTPWFSPWNMSKCLQRSLVPLNTLYEHEARRTMIKLIRAAAFLLCTAVSAPVMAQDFDEGLAAAQAGDYATALQEWRPLAEQGHASAQYNLGVMYDNGREVLQDYVEAVIWYRRAADLGHASAQNNLGFLYDSGRGVMQDYAEAVIWYRRAADLGHVSAQYNLGVMYNTGLGVTQDYAEAMIWYRRAAEQGHATAQTNLGFTYHNGRGVLQDAVLAHMWYNIGGANGNAGGSDNRGLIEELMTREQIAEAQARARRCMSSNYQDCD